MMMFCDTSDFFLFRSKVNKPNKPTNTLCTGLVEKDVAVVAQSSSDPESSRRESALTGSWIRPGDARRCFGGHEPYSVGAQVYLQSLNGVDSVQKNNHSCRQLLLLLLRY